MSSAFDQDLSAVAISSCVCRLWAISGHDSVSVVSDFFMVARRGSFDRTYDEATGLGEAHFFQIMRRRQCRA